MLLAQDRKFAHRALRVFEKHQRDEKLTIAAVVSERSFYETVTKIFGAGIPWVSNEQQNETEILDLIRSYKIDAAISLQHRWIMSEKLIDAVGGYAFNTHFGKLPQYRGHYPHIHAILNGEDFVTTTLHWIQPKVDMGDIVTEARTAIENDDTSWSLWHKSVDEAVALQDNLLNYLISRTMPPRRTVTGEGTFFRVDSIDGLKQINDLSDFDEVDKKTRAFYYPPHEPAYFVLNVQKYYVIPKGVYHKTVV